VKKETVLLVLFVFLPDVLFSTEKPTHDKVGIQSKFVGQGKIQRPNSCNPDSPGEVSRPYTPTTTVQFAWVKKDKVGNAELSAPHSPGAVCLPVVFKKVPNSEVFQFVGPLCAEARALERRSQQDPTAPPDRTQEIKYRTFLDSASCAMPKTHQWYTQIWSEAERKFLKVAIPCVLAWDSRIQPQACVENNGFGMTDVYDLYKVDEVMQAIDRINFEKNIHKWKNSPQGGPSILDVGSDDWVIG